MVARKSCKNVLARTDFNVGQCSWFHCMFGHACCQSHDEMRWSVSLGGASKLQKRMTFASRCETKTTVCGSPAERPGLHDVQRWGKPDADTCRSSKQPKPSRRLAKCIAKGSLGASHRQAAIVGSPVAPAELRKCSGPTPRLVSSEVASSV